MQIKDLKVIPDCDLCGSKLFHLFSQVQDRNYLTGYFSYVQCNKCKLVWLNPRPKPNVLHAYYPRAYPAYQKPQKTHSEQTTFRYFLKKYLWLAKLFIKDDLYYKNPKGKLLDIGCGSGNYLEILNSWGWQAEGVEISKQAAAAGRNNGLRIKQGTLFSVKYAKNSFDVIRFSHALEHVPSPRLELLETKRILKKFGFVKIFVPNIDSLTFRIFRSYWYLYETPRHFYQFTPETLTTLLLKTGFINITIKYHQSPNTIWWSLKYLFGKTRVDTKMGFLRHPLGWILKPVGLLKFADVIEATAKKG